MHVFKKQIKQQYERIISLNVQGLFYDNTWGIDLRNARLEADMRFGSILDAFGLLCWDHFRRFFPHFGVTVFKTFVSGAFLPFPVRTPPKINANYTQMSQKDMKDDDRIGGKT